MGHCRGGKAIFIENFVALWFLILIEVAGIGFFFVVE
jgi:hypothetical protein